MENLVCLEKLLVYDLTSTAFLDFFVRLFFFFSSIVFPPRFPFSYLTLTPINSLFSGSLQFLRGVISPPPSRAPPSSKFLAVFTSGTVRQLLGSEAEEGWRRT